MSHSTQKLMIVTQVWGGREMWREWGKDVTILNQLNIVYHTEIDDCYTGLGVEGMGGGRGGGKDVTILNQLNIAYHTEIDDCYTGLGVTGDVREMGGRTLQY